MTYDLLVKDGTIIDGSGKERFRGDVAIEGGRIKNIGAPNLPGADAEKIISAFGKFVTPGFIDITSHADKNWSLFANPLQDYLLTQGVTTILAGNCGSSLAPLVSREAVDSLKKWGGSGGITINWLTVKELLDELSRHPLGLNVATLMGHGTIRRGILKGESRPLSPEELQQCAELIEYGMADGAFGLSAGLVYSHEAAASEEELTLLAKTLARAGGIYKTHLRNEGPNLVPAVNEAIQIGRASGASVIISHFKATGRKSWPFFGKTVQMLERANENGAKFHFDVSPYLRTGSFLYLLLPAWARDGGFAAMLERIATPDSRKKIIEELKQQTLHYDRYIIANSVTPSANGKTIVEIAENMGQTPEEAILELLAANKGDVIIFGKTLSAHNLAAAIEHPLGIIASDGSGVTAELGRSGKLVHPRSTGTFPHFLHRFVNEKKIVSWEEGIRKITALPAETVGISERGRLARNFHADVVVFDPEKIQDRSTYDNPYVHSAGIEAVAVNGELAIENSQLTGKAAGRILKKS